MGEKSYDEMSKRERGEQGLEDLRDLLEEIVEVGDSRHPGIDAVRDTAAGLEGLDRAEEALRKWRERDVEGECQGGHTDIEGALDELRSAASAELREASMEDVLAAAETGLRDSGTLHPDDVVQIEGETWQIAPALRALYDHDLDVEDVLEAITAGDVVDGDGDVLVIDHETAPMILARMHIVDALPPRDSERRSVEEIVEECDRDEEYVRDELERLAGWGVADTGVDGARLAHDRVEVESLVSEDG